jgi:hypothetical protein
MWKVSGTVTNYLPFTGMPLVAESRMLCGVDSPPPLVSAMRVAYSRPESLHTSETIEFFLGFSTGLMAGVVNAANRDQSRLDVSSFERKRLLIP